MEWIRTRVIVVEKKAVEAKLQSTTLNEEEFLFYKNCNNSQVVLDWTDSNPSGTAGHNTDGNENKNANERFWTNKTQSK